MYAMLGSFFERVQVRQGAGEIDSPVMNKKLNHYNANIIETRI
jgi:hypothetical protein